MLATIEQEEQMAMQEMQRKADLEAKLASMEQNMVKGKQFMEKAIEQEEELRKKQRKLKKLWDKYQKAQQEMIDVQQFNQGEREDMLSMIRQLRRELKLKTMIMESFVPPKEISHLQDRATWDCEEDEWRIAPARIDKENRPMRPGSALGLPRPMSEFARINRA